jgi:hypothetical protein
LHFQVLYYCYKFEIVKDLFSQESALDMLYAADKYKLPGMMEQCVDFLMDHVDEANCLVVFNQTHRLDCARINDKCMKMIQEDPLKFFEDAFFTNLQFTAVRMIVLGMPSMNCTGACLKRAVFSWFLANNVCKPTEINNDAVFLRRGLRAEDFVDKPFHSVNREGHHLMETRTFKNNITRLQILTDRWLFGVGLCLGVPGNSIDEKVKLTILQSNVEILSVERTVKQSEYFTIEEFMFKKLKVPRGMLHLIIEYQSKRTRCVTTHSVCDIEEHYTCGPYTYCDENLEQKCNKLRAVDNKDNNYSCLTHLIYANS